MPPISFRIRQRPRRTINYGENNNSARNAHRRAVQERGRRNLMENLATQANANALARARQSAARYRQANNSERAAQVRGALNRIVNGNRSQARNILRSLSPSTIRTLSVAALMSLLVLSGYAVQAYRAIRRGGGNNNASRQYLFRIVQNISR